RLRQNLAAYFRKIMKAPSSVSHETLLASAKNSLCLGDYPSAVRAALLAARRLLRERRTGEVLDLFMPLVDLPPDTFGTRGGWGSRRAMWALRLRTAEIFTRAGKRADALKVLQFGPPGAPPWYRAKG